MVLLIRNKWGNGFPGGKESTCNVGDSISIPGSERYPGEGNGNPLKYPYLGNLIDRGAEQAPVHGVIKELDTTFRLNNKWGKKFLKNY